METLKPDKLPRYSDDYLKEGLKATPDQILDWLQEAIIFNYEATRGREWVWDMQEKFRRGELDK